MPDSMLEIIGGGPLLVGGPVPGLPKIIPVNKNEIGLGLSR